jgi:hypothetical protein
MTKPKNVRNATVAGATASGAGSVLITIGALALSKRIGLPPEACAALLATPVAFISGLVARWAAKLNPHE